MKKSLYDQINDSLKARQSWADKQHTNYTMRNGGIRRRSKPYPHAPDGWYPLGDTLTEKLKPPYIQQVYGAETVANFVCLKSQDDTETQNASYWFDYQLKQRSNFERTMFVAIDQMLEQGFTPVKVYWDTKQKRLAFDQVDPLHLIVPSSTQEYNANGGTDWMVHILHLSVAEYKANPNFEQDDEFVKRIKGKGNPEDAGDDKKQTVDLKEGINCSSDENEIVLWECYKRDRKDHRIEIETISPLLDCDDEENVVRPSFRMPYNRGCFAKGEHFPFFKIRAEIKGKGHYSSRGIIEINAPFEMSLTKTWNTIHEWQDFFAKPMFKNIGASPIPNANNWKSGPGKIMPAGLDTAVPPQLPNFLRESMEMTRAVAEDRTQVPDLGAGQHLAGDQGSGGKVTATQINAIVGQSGQGNDMRARVFRLDLGEGLQMAWSILLQFGNAEEFLMYLVDGERQTLDQAALHEDYEIVPNGSADSWNKGAMVAQRTGLYQMLQQNPFVPLGELTKFLLEAIDPRLVKRLYKDPEMQAADESEDQAMECLLLAAGWPAVVQQADDDKTHLAVLDQFVQDKYQKVQLTPEMAKLLLDHGIQHMGALKEKKDPMLSQVEAKLKPTAELLSMIAAQAGPQNILPMQQPAGLTPGVSQDSPLSPTGPAGAATPQPEMAQI